MPADERARLAHVRPVVTFVAERERAAVLAALGTPPRTAHLRTSLRSSDGFQVEGDLVATHPSSAPEALQHALAALGEHDLLVAEGPLAIDLLRADLSIAVVTSESPALLPRDLRAVRHRVDLFLFEARPALLRTLAARIAARARPVVASGA